MSLQARSSVPSDGGAIRCASRRAATARSPRRREVALSISARRTSRARSSCTSAARCRESASTCCSKSSRACAQRHPSLRLIRVGGKFTREQQRQVARLGLERHITVLPFVDRRVLAAVYRRATMLLQPSDREGFGLPVAEAMACGTPVVASDLQRSRSRRGDRDVLSCGRREAWTQAVSELLDERAAIGTAGRARRAASLADARRFDALEHARQMTGLYRDLLPGTVRGQRESVGDRGMSRASHSASRQVLPARQGGIETVVETLCRGERPAADTQALVLNKVNQTTYEIAERGAGAHASAAWRTSVRSRWRRRCRCGSRERRPTSSSSTSPIRWRSLAYCRSPVRAHPLIVWYPQRSDPSAAGSTGCSISRCSISRFAAPCGSSWPRRRC